MKTYSIDNPPYFWQLKGYPWHMGINDYSLWVYSLKADYYDGFYWCLHLGHFYIGRWFE